MSKTHATPTPAPDVRLTPAYIALRRERDALLRQIRAAGLQHVAPARAPIVPPVTHAHGTLAPTNGATGRTPVA